MDALNTPILFLVFNRPDTTKKVFEAIRNVKPKQLFVAADGPRNDLAGENELCEEVRKIATQIDWDCELKTLFRDKNMGCGMSPADSITWFFENVEQGIILEDDCLPNNSFFNFCEQLLNKFSNDNRVFLISGSNPLIEFKETSYSYLFSRYGGIWGWATWKRAWDKYDFSIASWERKENKQRINSFFKDKKARDYYTGILDQTFSNRDVSWWDYQWFYTRIIEKSIAIVPAKNLISNIGFGANATHTIDATALEGNLENLEMENFLIHPPTMTINKKFEKKINQFAIKRGNFFYELSEGFTPRF